MVYRTTGNLENLFFLKRSHKTREKEIYFNPSLVFIFFVNSSFITSRIVQLSLAVSKAKGCRCLKTKTKVLLTYQL